MLMVGTIAGHEPDLRQGILEPNLLGSSGITNIRVESPVRALWNLRDDETPGDVGNPVSTSFVSPPGCFVVAAR